MNHCEGVVFQISLKTVRANSCGSSSFRKQSLKDQVCEAILSYRVHSKPKREEKEKTKYNTNFVEALFIF